MVGPVSGSARGVRAGPDGRGDALVLIESPDLAGALLGLVPSDEPFDVWFREHLLAVHGIDLTAGMSLPEQVLGLGA